MGRSVPIIHREAAADPQVLLADPRRALAELGWEPRRSSLDSIVEHAWRSK
ncbi:hypothetical protein [Labedaea rhizosphaerae]|uniref:Uncharacterized protein n=1 Tax=Labedaea rhizosphaerae TaxID=598644 RepID=A0A4V3D0E1_LABRH|nr:hypothetical protein [Labedaea rhizosphaerae]TDQ05455.1 hypothetical protein EV186_1011426 [Labedaea rhizosphaerae]